MAYLTTKLLTNAWYLSGWVSRQFETVSGAQLSDSLGWLNALIAAKAIDGRLIPYYREEEIELEQGTQKYFIERLLEAQAITFNQQTVRFATKRMGRKAYFGTARVDGVQSLPFTVRAERTLGGTDLYFYYLPDSDFPAKIFGKFALESVTRTEDLEEKLEPYYIDYLKYLLAYRICQENNVAFPPDNKAYLEKFESQLVDVSGFDLSVTKSSTLQKQTGMNWAYVNFPGWTPS